MVRGAPFGGHPSRFEFHPVTPDANAGCRVTCANKCETVLHRHRPARELAEGVGSAPTSVVTDPVFDTGAASLYLPAFHKMAARVGLAPTPNGLTGRHATLTLRDNG